MISNPIRIATACLCVFQLSVPAQTPAPAQAPPSAAPPVIRTVTRMVQVNVVVHRKGLAVPDLKKEDFTIFDQGQQQKVASFSVESSQPLTTALGTKAAPLPPNTFTNRVELKQATPNAITVILLDGLNSRLEDQMYAKQQVVKFLQQLQPGDRVALYSLGRQLRILHDFTSDSASLLRILARHNGHLGPEVADSEYLESDTGNEEMDQWLNEASQQIADFQTINRVKTTQAALEAIANHVSRLPGRKNLIWISGGFPFSIGLDGFNVSNTQEQRTFSDELERAARSVNAANLAIYPIDTRGLVGSPDFAASTKGPSNPRRPPQAGDSKAMRNLQQAHDVMEIIAQRTGGKAYYNSNDIRHAIRSAIDDAKVTYVLGYYPSHNTWDGKFHELKVQVDRKGLDVRHRKGYFAFPEQPLKPEDRQKALQEAAWSALDATTVGLTVRLGRDIPKPGRLRVVMLVSARNIAFQQKDDRWVGTADLLFVQQPAADQPAKVVNDTLSMQLTRERYLTALKEGLLFAKDLNLADAAYQLRVAVRDATTGNVGSVNVRTDRLKPEPPAKPAEVKK